MAMRIVVNGREYASVEAMSEEDRRAYAELLSHLKDTDGNGTPDLLERPLAGKAVMVEHVKTLNLGIPKRADALDATANVLTQLLKILVIVGAVMVAFFGSMMWMNLDEGSRSQGGAFYVALGVLLLLGWLLGQYMSISRRR